VNAIAPPLDIAPAHWAIVADILRRLAPDYEVWAFGSRATGRAKPYSDLDLAIVSDRPLPLDLTARLAEAFSESDLPWKVDLVDWATTDDAFRGIIMSQRVVVQSARK
jgi:type I restriction enzyme S subunit